MSRKSDMSDLNNPGADVASIARAASIQDSTVPLPIVSSNRNNNSAHDNAIQVIGDIHGAISFNLTSFEIEHYKRVVDWINPSVAEATGKQDDKHNDFHEKTQRKVMEGTGRWFLDSKQFALWRESEGSVLWLRGPGKYTTMTILCGLTHGFSGLRQDGSMCISF